MCLLVDQCLDAELQGCFGRMVRLLCEQRRIAFDYDMHATFILYFLGVSFSSCFLLNGASTSSEFYS
jgi:hypothetical protein